MLFLVFSGYSQKSDSITMILENTQKACSLLKSIEYNIQQKGVKGKEWLPKINANIIQQRADVNDIGFDKSMIKAEGTIMERGLTEAFSFAYNGDVFTYKRGGNTIKEIDKPTRQVTMGLLQQHLFMLRIFPYTEVNFFKTNEMNPYSYEGMENINGEPCYKIKLVIGMTMPNSEDSNKRTLQRTEIWWINKKSFLPIAFSDGFLYKEVKIVNYEF